MPRPRPAASPDGAGYIRGGGGVEIGPTRHGITRGMTIYGFDPSGNRFETFCGGLQSYPDQAPIAWTLEEMPSGLDYPSANCTRPF